MLKELNNIEILAYMSETEEPGKVDKLFKDINIAEVCEDDLLNSRRLNLS